MSATSIITFCNPPVPGKSHEYYGSAHNQFIKLPIKVIEQQKFARVLTAAPNTTIHSIASSGNINLLKTFLEEAKPNSQKIANERHPITGLTPLHFASSRGHYQVVQCLVEQYSTTIDLKDREGETALLKAAYNGHYVIVKYLVANHANIQAKDNDGWTALHNACSRGHLEICKFLIQSGAYVDVKSKMGHTPLINAASKGHTSIVQYLLDEAHSNPLIKNNFGEAAYDVAAAATETRICDMLYRAGKIWWDMQYDLTDRVEPYILTDFHVTVLIVLHENERLSSLFGLSKLQFSPASLSKNEPHWLLASTGEPCTKEQVQLPHNNENNSFNWFWLTDWQIECRQPQVDYNTGWQYAHHLDDPEELWTPNISASGFSWVRRRQWVRVMKRRLDLTNNSHLWATWRDEKSDYFCIAQDLVEKSEDKEKVPEIEQLTRELRAYEEAVQVLYSGIKNDRNHFRAKRAHKLTEEYTILIEEYNDRIKELVPAISTQQVTRQAAIKENWDLIHELGSFTSDPDANPWSAYASSTGWSLNFDKGVESTDIQTAKYGDNELQNTWESDEDVKQCRKCERKFSMILRKHHCRHCGLIFCDRCSLSRIFLKPHQIQQDPNNFKESVDELSLRYQRVCDFCYTKLDA